MWIDRSEFNDEMIGFYTNKLKLLMGHQSIAMTDIYTHLNPMSAVKEYQNIMGMNQNG